MSPYADFPKSNRTSMEWGREAIEMQENGSTKNLLQMSDIYYSVRRSFVAHLTKKNLFSNKNKHKTLTLIIIIIFMYHFSQRIHKVFCRTLRT